MCKIKVLCSIEIEKFLQNICIYCATCLSKKTERPVKAVRVRFATRRAFDGICFYFGIELIEGIFDSRTQFFYMFCLVLLEAVSVVHPAVLQQNQRLPVLQGWKALQVFCPL